MHGDPEEHLRTSALRFLQGTRVTAANLVLGDLFEQDSDTCVMIGTPEEIRSPPAKLIDRLSTLFEPDWAGPAHLPMYRIAPCV